MKIGRFIVLKSPDGKEPWAPVPPAEVPEWVKNPDVLDRMKAGEECQQGECGEWFRAVLVGKSELLAPKDIGLKHKPAALAQVQGRG